MLSAASQSPKFSITCRRILADLHTQCKPSSEFQSASSLYFPAKTLFEVWLSVLPTLQIRKGLPGILLSSALSSATFQSNLHNKIKLGRGGRDPRVKCSHAKEPTGRKQGLHPLEDKPRNLCINYSSFTPSLACISSSQLDFEAMA